jgi:hypothetical protein
MYRRRGKHRPAGYCTGKAGPQKCTAFHMDILRIELLWLARARLTEPMFFFFVMHYSLWGQTSTQTPRNVDG